MLIEKRARRATTLSNLASVAADALTKNVSVAPLDIADAAATLDRIDFATPLIRVWVVDEAAAARTCLSEPKESVANVVAPACGVRSVERMTAALAPATAAYIRPPALRKAVRTDTATAIDRL